MLNSYKFVALAMLLLMPFFQPKANARLFLSFYDTTLCPGETFHICATFNSQNASSNQDDKFSDPVYDLGFPFHYFSSVFTKGVVSGNGILSFDTSLAGGYSSYIYSSAVSSGQLDTAILFPFQDTYPGGTTANGMIRIQSTGLAPHRIFVVDFCHVRMFSCTSTYSTTQLVLHEGSNDIEMFLTNKPLCTTWQSGTGVQGLKYSNTTVYVPGRDGTGAQWTASNEGWLFKPNDSITPSNYTISNIPYNPYLILDSTATVNNTHVYWYKEGDTVVPVDSGNCADLTVQNGVHYYVAKFYGTPLCNDLAPSIGTYTDTVWIHSSATYDTVKRYICAYDTVNFYDRILNQTGVYDTFFANADGCSAFHTLILKVNPVPTAKLSGIDTSYIEICDWDTLAIGVKSDIGNHKQWYKDEGVLLSGETNDIYYATTSGHYYAMCTTDSGCFKISDTVELKVNPRPMPKITSVSSSDVCIGDTVTFKVNDQDYGSYITWTPVSAFNRASLNTTQEASAIVDSGDYFAVEVMNKYGCTNSDSVYVYAHPCCEMYLPTAFTPNGDGVNDIIKPILSVGQSLITLQIYNRKGQKIFETRDPSNGWKGVYNNGTECPMETYMYFIEYSCTDGKNYTKKGDITLIR